MQTTKKNISADNIDLLVNLIPFKNTVNDIQYILKHGPLDKSNLLKNILGNILLFLPLPFFLNRIFNIQKSATILFIAFLLSVWVEVMQYIFILGVPDIDDVILNVLGALIGWVLITYIKSEFFNPENQ